MTELHENVNAHTIALKVKSFPNANVIENNFNQGILIVEGSYAHIISNKIDSNIKGNIALGGEKTGLTRIKYNYIWNSRYGEGIFVIEGEENLLIEDNQIEHNNDGIVLVDSQGTVKGNSLKGNIRSGILNASNNRCTTAKLIDNTIEGSNIGIIIKDPSEPQLRKNQIEKNDVQVEMERMGAQKNWTNIQRENPLIVGTNVIPTKSTCSIF